MPYDSTKWQFSGEYIGTYEGNDDAVEITAIMLGKYGETLDIEFCGKNEGNATEGALIDLDYNDVSTNYKSGTHGTWAVADSNDELEFYTVKGGTNFSFFLLPFH